MSGFCTWPGMNGDSHRFCHIKDCICGCHKKEAEE